MQQTVGRLIVSTRLLGRGACFACQSGALPPLRSQRERTVGLAHEELTLSVFASQAFSHLVSTKLLIHCHMISSSQLSHPNRLRLSLIRVIIDIHPLFTHFDGFS